MSRLMLSALLAFFLMPVATLAAGPEAEAKAAVETKEDAKADAKADVKEDAKAEEGEAEKPEAEEPKEDAEGDVAPTEEPEPTAEEMVEMGKGIVAAARSHEWALMLAGIIMLILSLARRFKLLAKLPTKAVPWVSAALGVLAVLGDDLATGGAITVSRLVQGLLAGLAASGAWGLIGRHLPMIGAQKAEES